MKIETLQAPVSGIVSFIVKPSGSKVHIGELILNIEIMKLFYSVTAGLSGNLQLTIQEGEFVQESQGLGTITED